ncbi:anthranilate synthase component II [Francisella adeliensis]|uniref:Anthranilate synthase component II n=1 Tax=Francisella adeliensis TaxID=2007306 RepID=A0A2Z4XZE2_9GAMM|nr:aminodeoxychorismate/anthranilate synthase component II [Francisella adeliensis]AXA33805.1 anthranilate synthase component II [Francisella adeliensis]MBK2085704.1 aminodeoxychorismate/anthranilate synthase component II [Francisella adeliensis]MBK2097582.1 aminodeoxychorismate/anthranilate synthase component II [Francisella adeliensis]QIW12040.1 aminodeoxychorismate/anthranilate synthase component II [Francisella adeliensis]QIW13915.1 aminodeoxychorismate/anthranilate synthase component II [
MILYLDHYDSFANTIYSYISLLGYEVVLHKTDNIPANLSQFTHIIIGPGPGHPNEIKHLYKTIEYCELNNKPLLGICLGHQLIAQYFGSGVIKAKNIFHGKSSKVTRSLDTILLNNHPQEFDVIRYHSLIIDSIKKPLKISAITKANEIMAFEHSSENIFGLQYHPEAYLSEYGFETLNNFLKI